MSRLNEPITIGDLKLRNRIIMSPLTRSRAAENRIPTDLMREYYVQRASAGLIITEATVVSELGAGYAKTPGIWSQEQVKAWQPIVQAVHDAGGLIFMQLWHVGRISDPMFTGGQTPVAPSAVKAAGHVSLVRPEKEYSTPRALTLEEIVQIVEQFRQGAENAKAAGFDGVEIHGANGYLLDQFLQDKTNKRTDQYGGSIENRARFMLEVTDAAISVWGAGRVGMHLAPRGDAHDMGDSNKLETFSYVARELGKRKIAFICARERIGDDWIGPQLKKAFGGVYIANEKFSKEMAEQVINEGQADAVAFGSMFIANPDLPKRLATNAPLNPPNMVGYYFGGAEGYTDYPALSS